MVCLWIAWVCQWFVYGLPVVCISVAGGLSMVCLWFAYGLPMVWPWFCHGFFVFVKPKNRRKVMTPSPDREATMWKEILGSCVSASKRQKKHGGTLEFHIAKKTLPPKNPRYRCHSGLEKQRCAHSYIPKKINLVRRVIKPQNATVDLRNVEPCK